MDRGNHNEYTDEGRLAKKIKNFIYHPTDTIGSGFSSHVYKGINQIEADPNKKTIAIKVIELAKVQNQVQKYLFNNEVNALKSIKHPNVLNTIDILMTKNNVYIITQFCEGGDLLKHIRKEGTYSPLEGLKIMKDIVSGYVCIEQMKIIHRDLKTANIFLKNGVAKIADFGFCEFIGDKKPQIAYNVGSPAYMSPESYKENLYSAKSDIWGIGIILYEILVGQTPDKNLTYTEMVTNLMNGKITKIQNEEVRRILSLCFKKNLNERITAKNLLELINAEINRLLGYENRKNLSNRVIQPTNNMTSSVPPSSQPPQFRDTRLYSPARKREIHFNRAQNMPQRISSSQIQENQGSSRKMPSPQNTTSKLKSQTEMLLFIYRLLKFLGTEASNERLLQTHLILFRHRNLVDSLVENLKMSDKNEEFQQYVYLRSRFDEVYLQISREHPVSAVYRQRLQKYLNSHFLDFEALKLYKQIIRQGCGECIAIFQTRPQAINWNPLGVILDYLMIEFEILSLHLDGKTFYEVVKIAQVDSIIREQPKKVTQAHLQLLKYKYNKLISPFSRQPQQRVNPFIIENNREGENRISNQFPITRSQI